MKKLLSLLSFILIANIAISQSTSLSGCLGVKFGSNQKETKEIIEGKNAGFNLYSNTDDVVSYSEGTFANHECIGIIYYFYNNSFHSAKVLLEVSQSPKVFDFYNKIVSEVQDKYGISPYKEHIFKYPFEEGDGHEVSAIRGGYADIKSYFNFDDGNVITVSITENLDVLIIYQNVKLAEEAINASKKKSSGDY